MAALYIFLKRGVHSGKCCESNWTPIKQYGGIFSFGFNCFVVFLGGGFKLSFLFLFLIGACDDHRQPLCLSVQDTSVL